MPDATPPPVAPLDDYWDTIEVPHDPAERERWQVDGDRTAGWAMRKLAQLRAEQARLDALHAQDLAVLDQDYRERRRALDDWLVDASTGAAVFAQLLTDKLMAYHQRLLAEREDLAATYRLPGGALTHRRNPPSLDVTDADALVKWCVANDRLDLLDIKPSKAAIKAAIGLTLWAPEIKTNAKGEPTVPGQESKVCTADSVALPGVAYRVGDTTFGVKPEAVTP